MSVPSNIENNVENPQQNQASNPASSSEEAYQGPRYGTPASQANQASQAQQAQRSEDLQSEQNSEVDNQVDSQVSQAASREGALETPEARRRRQESSVQSRARSSAEQMREQGLSSEQIFEKLMELFGSSPEVTENDLRYLAGLDVEASELDLSNISGQGRSALGSRPGAAPPPPAPLNPSDPSNSSGSPSAPTGGQGRSARAHDPYAVQSGPAASQFWIQDERTEEAAAEDQDTLQVSDEIKDVIKKFELGIYDTFMLMLMIAKILRKSIQDQMRETIVQLAADKQLLSESVQAMAEMEVPDSPDPDDPDEQAEFNEAMTLRSRNLDLIRQNQSEIKDQIRSRMEMLQMYASQINNHWDVVAGVGGAQRQLNTRLATNFS